MKLGVQMLAVALISDTESIQSRAEVHPEAVEDYSAAMRAGATFPPIVVFFDGTTYRIADGLHRYTATINHGGTELLADVREGGRFEALLHAVGANAHHGLRRTNKDKAHAVGLLLGEASATDWSDRKVADACGVSHTMVANARRLRSGNGCHAPRHETGNESDSMPPPASSEPRSTPARSGNQTRSLPPTSLSSAREPDPVHVEAARFEERLLAVTNDICAASVRHRRLLASEVEMCASRLLRAVQGSAA